ncbi:uncharacterized protein LOC143876359 [Tasmannia lanceolata]|uniref:uncharacterized protein LOC143876359 n=1 Tax=Tasmannia lanceolata TaxID=3420 RepID=UPI0040630C71
MVLSTSNPLLWIVSANDLCYEWKEICLGSAHEPKIIQDWEPPAHGFLKLDFDGSSMGNPIPSGIGRVLRDEFGAVRWAFAGPIGVADANEDEVRAIHQGIKLLVKEDMNRLVLEGDSFNVIRWLKGSHSYPWRFVPYFDEIQDRVGEASISFIM